MPPTWTRSAPSPTRFVGQKSTPNIPLPLGVNSVAEYVSIKAQADSELLDRLQNLCPLGMKFVKMWTMPTDVNLAAKITRADYEIVCQGIGGVIEEVTADGYQITYVEKGAEVTKDVSARIFAARRDGADKAKVTLAVGNENLRPDRLVRYLMQKYDLNGDYDVTKIDSYTADGIAVDEWLDSIENGK